MAEFTEAPPVEGNSEERERQAYTTPMLIDYGSIAELTGGTFAGVGADNAIYS